MRNDKFTCHCRFSLSLHRHYSVGFYKLFTDKHVIQLYDKHAIFNIYLWLRNKKININIRRFYRGRSRYFWDWFSWWFFWRVLALRGWMATCRSSSGCSGCWRGWVRLEVGCCLRFGAKGFGDLPFLRRNIPCAIRSRSLVGILARCFSHFCYYFVGISQVLRSFWCRWDELVLPLGLNIGLNAG